MPFAAARCLLRGALTTTNREIWSIFADRDENLYQKQELTAHKGWGEKCYSFGKSSALEGPCSECKEAGILARLAQSKSRQNKIAYFPVGMPECVRRVLFFFVLGCS